MLGNIFQTLPHPPETNSFLTQQPRTWTFSSKKSCFPYHASTIHKFVCKNILSWIIWHWLKLRRNFLIVCFYSGHVDPLFLLHYAANIWNMLSYINTIRDFECRRMASENQFRSFQSPTSTLQNGGIPGKHNKLRSLSRQWAFRFHYRRFNGNEWGASKWTLSHLWDENCWIFSIRILNFHYRYFHRMAESNMKLFIVSYTTSPKRFFFSRLTQFFNFHLLPILDSCHCWKFFFHEFLMLCKWFMTFFIML